MSLQVATGSTARVENSFKQLAAAAQALNHASDDLGKVVRHLDGALKKLALGISVWVQVSGTSDETQYFASEIGYIKLDGKWCIALREASGYLQDSADEHEETWAFSDAPRALRAEAVDKIPDLLEKLLQQTEEATRDLKKKTEQAAELAFMVSNLVPEPAAPTPQTWHRPPAGSTMTAGRGEGGQSDTSSTVARFRNREALPAERTAGASASGGAAAPSGTTPANGSATPAATPAAANGRFREVESAGGERPARVLPPERVS